MGGIHKFRVWGGVGIFGRLLGLDEVMWMEPCDGIGVFVRREGEL